jgi:hypothetical protein
MRAESEKIAKAEGKDSKGRRLRQKAKSQERFLAFSLSPRL